jgi:hypothetical protein
MPALPRSLVAAFAAVLLVGLVVAAPVSAVKPTPVATATLSERLCALIVGYNWSRFPGRRLVATVGLYERSGTGDVNLSSQSFADQVGRLGAVSYLTSLTADAFPGGRTLVVLGSLTDTKTGQLVPGSSVESATTVSTCG